MRKKKLLPFIHVVASFNKHSEASRNLRDSKSIWVISMKHSLTADHKLRKQRLEQLEHNRQSSPKSGFDFLDTRNLLGWKSIRFHEKGANDYYYYFF